MLINRSSTILLLEAKESLVHPLHYSVALHFHQKILQSGWHSLISEWAGAFLKEQASFGSEKKRERDTDCESIYSMKAHFKMLRK